MTADLQRQLDEQMTADLQRQLDEHERVIEMHSVQIRDIEIWKATTKGFLLALTIFASLPTIVLGWIALSGQF
ncbi:MAG: hypothetical protein KDA28_16470 [Phycisphaerales bacterium]|nr:hypothetical protein [Phycisphaerales bacterium]